MIDTGIALLAGIVTVASPCTLPLLPIVFTLAAQGNHPKRPYAIVAGFVGVKTLSIIAIALVGSAFGLSTMAWRQVSAVFFALFGIISFFPALSIKVFGGLKNLLSRINTEKSITATDLPSAFIGGGLLALIWAPCAGPALGTIGILLAAKKDLLLGFWLLFVFALGVGIPMLLIAKLGQRATKALQNTTKHLGFFQRLFGIFLLAVSVMLWFGLDGALQLWILDHTPTWYSTGNWRL